MWLNEFLGKYYERESKRKEKQREIDGLHKIDKGLNEQLQISS